MTKIDLNEIVVEYESNAAELIFSSNYCCLTLNGALGEAIVFAEKKMTEALAASQAIIVVNFAYVEVSDDKNSNQKVVKTLCSMKKLAESKGKRMAFIQFPNSLEKLLKKEISDTSNLLFSNVLQATKTSSSPDQCVEELAYFKNAVSHVFKVQFNLDPKLLISQYLEDAEGVTQGDVIGAAPLNSDGVSGNLMVGFPANVVISLGERVFGKKLSISDPDLLQVVGEITNMILGQAKEGMNRKGYRIGQIIPQVFMSTGKGGINVFVQRPSWYLRFKTEIGEFSLEIALKAT